MSPFLPGLRNRYQNIGCLFTFHRAVSDAAWANQPNRGFHLQLGFLDRVLTYLKRTGWRIVTMDEMIATTDEQPSYNKRPQRLVNFSVDDCYVDTWNVVAPLFRRHKAPLTLYVTTGIPDGKMMLGWAGLETLIARTGRLKWNGRWIDVSALAAKRSCFDQLTRSWDGNHFDRKYLAFCQQNGADAEALREEHAITWSMLSELCEDPLIEIGGHTISHPHLSAIDIVEAQHEIADCGAALRRRLAVPCRHFAFPYGRRSDCGPREFELAEAAGYASAATTRKGLIFPHQDRFSLPRNTINGARQSIASVEVALTGLAGSFARVLGRV